MIDREALFVRERREALLAAASATRHRRHDRLARTDAPRGEDRSQAPRPRVAPAPARPSIP